MKRSVIWIIICLANLFVVALLGVLLRTKILYPSIPVDYQNLLNAHSHFAFAAWLTLVFFILFIEKFLNRDQREKKIYLYLLSGIQICSVGMLVSFLSQNYGPLSIVFSTGFILFTYGFSAVFAMDFLKLSQAKMVRIFIGTSLLSLIISSAGPFYLAYRMATHQKDVIAFQNAIHFFLHFQYNGFFISAVLALLFSGDNSFIKPKKEIVLNIFAVINSISVPATFFSPWLQVNNNGLIILLRYTGFVSVIAMLVIFIVIVWTSHKTIARQARPAGLLAAYSLAAFILKMIIQILLYMPGLNKNMLSYRPAIVGYLHLVFLGIATNFILSFLISHRYIPCKNWQSVFSFHFFAAAIILQEIILFVNAGFQAMGNAIAIFDKLLWVAAVALLLGISFILGFTVKKCWPLNSSTLIRETF